MLTSLALVFLVGLALAALCHIVLVESIHQLLL